MMPFGSLISMARTVPIFVGICIMVLLAGCASQEQEERRAEQATLFTRLSPETTRIDFSNTLSERPTPHRNELLYEYFSNGAGVAAGDLNGDSLDDVYFTGNMSYNRLYLNKGNMVFDDVTDAAGVAGRKNTWKTGVAMADVNGDGRLDLYVCYSGDLPLDRRVDELFINQGNDPNGIPRFEEKASEYGLANPHSSNQAYFFDYDRDGDLDLFLLTHNVKRTPRRDREGTQEQLATEDPISGVRFYRNDEGYFEDVTRAVGIQSSELTYGLGAGVSDVDKDGWIDLYIGNDYSPPDYLYMNDGAGAFTDQLADRMGHTSNASMGIDVADINNDGWTDLFVLDMLAEDNHRQKTQFIPDDRALFKVFVESGFHHQYMRNTLQLNNGDGTFSEIGQLAGLANTDWSWAPLIADFDNDGRKDVFVTNGILHDSIDRDFLAFKNQYMLSKNYNLEPTDIAFLMQQMPSSDLRNYAFKNGGRLHFQDVSASWGLGQPLKSTGAAYSDLDNDGDLDLITNNINDYAYVFENHSDELPAHHYLRIDLRGEGKNTLGIGAKATLYAGGGQQYVEQMPMRGYLSSVSPTLHVGLGGQAMVDSLRIVWPDGKTQTVKAIRANQRITIHQIDAADEGDPPPATVPVFEETPSPVDFAHRMAGDIDDFLRQPLMVNPKSFKGPALATADVNGDGLVDVFVGGGNDQASRLFLQRDDGQFAAVAPSPFAADQQSDDVAALFFDADADGHLDLYVASGGYGAFAPDDAALQDRLYRNDGEGNLTRANDALPAMPTSTGAVAAADVNGDGWLDLFVGGHVVPGRYPEPPRSYVLINDGRGRFEDRTAEIAAALQHVGMVSDAAWHDLDGDGTKELIVVGAWMPIRVFQRIDGALTDQTRRYFEQPYSGLWNTVRVEDVNRDGRADLIVGNLGLNAQLRASEDQPAELYYGDFNFDGSVDPLLTFYIQGVSYPYLTLDELRRQMPTIGSRFSSHRTYAGATVGDIVTAEALDKAQKLEARWLETSLFIGVEGGGFERRALPIEAQFAPVFTIHPLDYNGDGHTDLLLGGNINEARIRLGKYDANYGMLLRGDENASFTYIPQHKSGLSLRGDVRSVIELENMLLFGVNRSAIRAYKLVGE